MSGAVEVVLKVKFRGFLFLVVTKRLYMSVCPSVGWSVRPSVKLSLFGLLGATNAVYTALFRRIQAVQGSFRLVRAHTADTSNHDDYE